MDRQEPVIDRGVKPLTNRVRLTWREVRDLADGKVEEMPESAEAAAAPDAGPKEPTLGAASLTEAPAPAPSPMPQAFEPVASAPTAELRERQPSAARTLSEEDFERLVAALAPRIEEAVAHAVSDGIDLILTNALSRAKGDIERSVVRLVRDATVQELRSTDFEALLRR